MKAKVAGCLPVRLQEDGSLKHAVVLDIGSSKVVCICGGRVGKDGVAVYGADIQPYAGYRFGKWADPAQVQEVVIQAIEATQRECNFRLREVMLSVPAPFIHLEIGEGALDLISSNGKPKRITNADIDMLMNESMPQQAPEGYVLMHSTPLFYIVDGAKRTEVPLDLVAGRLEGKVTHAYVQQSFLEPVQQAVEDLGLEIGACIASPLAQALLLLPEEKRRRPAVLIDVGYTHTDISVIEQEGLTALETIEVGGMHFAGDLSYGLEIPLSVAEQIKRRYVFSLDYQDSVELLRTPEGTRQVDRATIQYILEERAKELCAMIYQALLDMGVNLKARPAVHVTGGGLGMMRGSYEFIESMLGLRISRETPWMPRMSSPNYTSAFGTLEFVLHTTEDDISASKLQGSLDSGVLKKLREFFVK